MSETQGLPAGQTRAIGAARLAIGLFQGLAAYGLSRAAHDHAWPATAPPLFGALELVIGCTPLVLLAGLGHLRRSTFAAWALGAAALPALTAWHALFVAAPVALADGLKAPAAPNFAVIAFTAAALFILHHLIVAADQERKLVASYGAYFDATWLNGVKLGLAILFTGALWILLALGAALFGLIGLHGFGKLIGKPGFYFPATTAAFALAVQVADMRVALTRGLRTVGLILLSWLLPVMMLIALAFLTALPFTGLAPLWKAGSATAIVLGAMAALIILINAAYQDGEHVAPFALRWSARLTGLVLVVLAGLAAYGLWLRIGQHGLSRARVIAAACALVGAVYALGYAWAAVRPGRWMVRLERTNIAAAVLVVGLIVALFTPIADPSRIAVADQVARLERGEVAPARFDFHTLRFDSGRYGLEALRRLAAERGGANAAVIAPMAARALKWDTNCAYSDCRSEREQALQIAVYPAGQTLPADFLSSLQPFEFMSCRNGRSTCAVYLVDLGAAGPALLFHTNEASLAAYFRGPGGWSKVGAYPVGDCAQMLAALRSGTARPAAPRWPDLEASGRRIAFQPAETFGCATPASGAAVQAGPDAAERR